MAVSRNIPAVTYALLIALGLAVLAGHYLITHPTGRIIALVLAVVLFVIAALVTAVGPAWGV